MPWEAGRIETPALVIFDCDGVLVDSEPLSNGVLARMLSEQGLPTTLEQSRREYQGLMLDQVRERAQRRLGRPLPDGWLAEYERRRSAAFAAELAPVPGVAQALAQLRGAGVPVCVASQGKLEKTRLSLALTGLEEHFRSGTLFSAHAVARGKPHPDLFLHAARSMGAPPRRCAVIEDTPSGVVGAVAAGMRVLGYAADGDAEALSVAGAEIVWELAELPALLGLPDQPASSSANSIVPSAHTQ